MAVETVEQVSARLRGEATLAKLTTEQRGLLERLRECSGTVSTNKFYEETKAHAIALLDGLKEHGVVDYVAQGKEYVITAEGWHVAMANLNAVLKDYNDSSDN